MRRRKAFQRLGVSTLHHDPMVELMRAMVRRIVGDFGRQIARNLIAEYKAGIVARELATPGGTKTGWRIIDGQPVHWRKAKRLMRRGAEGVVHFKKSPRPRRWGETVTLSPEQAASLTEHDALILAQRDR